MELKSKAKIVILFAKTYDMLDEKQQQKKGCTVHYLFWGANGEELAEQSEWNIEKPVGVQRAKCSIDYDLRAKVPIAPALYEGDFVMTVGSDGKPVSRLVDVAYISNVDIKPRVVNGLVVPGMVTPAPEQTAEPTAEQTTEPAARKVK